MNKTTYQLLRLAVLVAYTGLLLSIALDWNHRLELIFCTVATVGSFILFQQKK